jgi:RNase H-fold protein (predicted Holliday junction resolvase)
VIDVVVTEYDERLTTVVAERGLRAGGGRRPARALRDAIAAQVMLQGYMDAGKGAP